MEKSVVCSINRYWYLPSTYVKYDLFLVLFYNIFSIMSSKSISGLTKINIFGPNLSCDKCKYYVIRLVYLWHMFLLIIFINLRFIIPKNIYLNVNIISNKINKMDNIIINNYTFYWLLFKIFKIIYLGLCLSHYL